MVAAPGGVVVDLGLPLRRELGKEATVVDELRVLVFLHEAEGVGERHFAVTVVMTIALAVGGHVDELGLVVVEETLLEA